MQEDAIAIEAIRQGDRERYGELVDRYERLVYGIAWSCLGNRAFCEDAVQETFVQGFRCLGALRRPERFAGWIARIARNIARRIERREQASLARLRRWQLEQGPAADDPGRDASRDEPVQETLSDALNSLSASHRECLVLFYLHGQSVRQASEGLGISEAAFKTRLHRARSALRERLEARLGPALHDLGPQSNSRDGVLAMLPAFPIGWGGGSGFSFSWVGTALKAGGIILILPLITFTLLAWVRRAMARNFRDGDDFRIRILRRNFIMLVVTVLPFLILAHLVVGAWGSEVLFVSLGVFMLPSMIQGVLTLRVCRTSFHLALAVGNALLAASCFAIGLWGAPFPVFLAAMLIYNLGLWQARSSTPFRCDYNLFLRAAMARLGNAGDQDALIEPLAMEELKAFTGFLGRRNLVVDGTWKRSGLVLYLPPVASNLVSSFLLPIARLNGSSTVTITRDGDCRARLSPRDRTLLQAHATEAASRPSSLEQQVAAAIRESLCRFTAGDESGAASVVLAGEELDIFIRPPHTLFAQRVIYGLAIVGAIVALAILLASGGSFLP